MEHSSTLQPYHPSPPPRTNFTHKPHHRTSLIVLAFCFDFLIGYSQAQRRMECSPLAATLSQAATAFMTLSWAGLQMQTSQSCAADRIAPHRGPAGSAPLCAPALPPDTRGRISTCCIISYILHDHALRTNHTLFQPNASSEQRACFGHVLSRIRVMVAMWKHG